MDVAVARSVRPRHASAATADDPAERAVAAARLAAGDQGDLHQRAGRRSDVESYLRRRAEDGDRPPGHTGRQPEVARAQSSPVASGRHATLGRSGRASSAIAKAPARPQMAMELPPPTGCQASRDASAGQPAAQVAGCPQPAAARSSAAAPTRSRKNRFEIVPNQPPSCDQQRRASRHTSPSRIAGVRCSEVSTAGNGELQQARHGRDDEDGQGEPGSAARRSLDALRSGTGRRREPGRPGEAPVGVGGGDHGRHPFGVGAASTSASTQPPKPPPVIRAP